MSIFAVFQNPRRKALVPGLAALLMLSGCGEKPKGTGDLSAEQVRAIAREAYVYGFPMVDSYRISYAYFVDKSNPEYKGPWNEIRSFARLMTPEDKAVQTPNSDTAYSFLGLDLRAEPVVITVPKMEPNRYFSVQLVDAYTFNFDYIGTRATGNDGGSYLIAGPGWKGEAPPNVKKVIRSETELLLAPFRTQLFNPGDIGKVKQIQAGYRAQTLSAFLNQPAPAAAAPIDFIKPLSPDEQKSSLEFFNILNFVLQFCPTHPSEKDLRARFAKLGITGEPDFDVSKLSEETKASLKLGIADAWEDYAGVNKQLEAGTVTSGNIFGTREHLKNNYLYRMLAAVWGIYGNSKEEAVYPTYSLDATGAPLDGAAHRYKVRFARNQMPPVKAFWSLTMYEMPASYLYPNSLNRYLLNSPMLPQFKRDSDGGLTFYIQHESPGKSHEANWLPAPKGPFKMVMRLYAPEPAALDGTWKLPPLEPVK